MMDEYIERKKAIFPLYRWRNIVRNTYGENDEYVKCLNEAIEKIENVAAADVKPVRHGKWSDGALIDPSGAWRINGFYCSVCGGLCVGKAKYCPNCGARMDGDNERAE